MNPEAATEDPVLGPPHAHPERITRPPKKDAGIGALGSSLAATAAPTVLLPVGGGRLSATARGSVGGLCDLVHGRGARVLPARSPMAASCRISRRRARVPV